VGKSKGTNNVMHVEYFAIKPLRVPPFAFEHPVLPDGSGNGMGFTQKADDFN
jgi:hypothetical protein